MQNLMQKAEFARLADANPSTITRLCRGSLKAACVGKKIDANHPTAVQYLTTRERKVGEAPATGLDPLYEEGVAACKANGRWTVHNIRTSLTIGDGRAKRILDTARANGVAPPEEPAPPKPPPKPQAERKKPGGAAIKEAKKREAYEAALMAGQETPTVPEEIAAFADYTIREVVEQFGSDARFTDYLKALKAIEDVREKQLKNEQTEGLLIDRELIRDKFVAVFNDTHRRMLVDGVKSIVAEVLAKSAAGSEQAEIEESCVDILGAFIKQAKNKVARALRDVGA